jgi:hypothetical protein
VLVRVVSAPRVHRCSGARRARTEVPTRRLAAPRSKRRPQRSARCQLGCCPPAETSSLPETNASCNSSPAFSPARREAVALSKGKSTFSARVKN